jgi:integrase/recombinase XerD
MISIHDAGAGGKCLTEKEHRRFLEAADPGLREGRALCHTLAWTGCRISEALALTAERIDVEQTTITFESLESARAGCSAPCPSLPELATMLDLAFGVRGRRGKAARPRSGSIRAPPPAWRRIKEVLAEADIEGARPAPGACAIRWAQPQLGAAFRSTWCSAGSAVGALPLQDGVLCRPPPLRGEAKRVSSAACLPLPCSTHSTWCTASTSDKKGLARALSTAGICDDAVGAEDRS